MLLGEITHGSSLPNSRQRDEQKSLLRVLAMGIDDRRRCWDIVRCRLQSVGLEVGEMNQNSDPACWAHCFRMWVYEVHEQIEKKDIEP